jgi:ketosteroid isomerase-like protein
MSGAEQVRLARESYQAFAAGTRDFFETHLSEDFSFSAPPDPHLDRDGWFERCWPAAGKGQEFELLRLVEADHEVIVNYELRRPDGSGGRNTEILTFDDAGKIARIEVYFGWDRRDERTR